MCDLLKMQGKCPVVLKKITLLIDNQAERVKNKFKMYANCPARIR